MRRIASKKHFLEIIHTIASPHWVKIPSLKGAWADLFILLLLAGLGFGFALYANQFTAPLQTKVDMDLSPLELPK